MKFNIYRWDYGAQGARLLTTIEARHGSHAMLKAFDLYPQYSKAEGPAGLSPIIVKLDSETQPPMAIDKE